MSGRPWVTVVGNGVAGYACASDLAHAGARVTLIGPGLPCDRPPLSKRALVTGRAPFLADAAGIAAAGIEHVDGVAEELDLVRRRLAVRGAGELEHRPFEQLVWATGLRPTRPPLPGMELADENAHPAGLQRLLPGLAAAGRSVAVVGAGLIGTETAATLATRHRVTLLERADRPLERFHGHVSAAAREVLADLGVEFIGDCGLEAVEPLPGGGRRLRITGRAPLDVDVLIVAAGVASTLPGALGDGPQIDTDERLAVPGHDGVWVCGDLARYPHPRHGRIHVPHWDNARAGGRHVAAAILGSADPFVREPYWFSDIGPLRLQVVGREQDARVWVRRDEFTIGLDAHGDPCCVLLVNAPRRLADARRLLAA
jgi:3-phenylpropionate/trans-cinnamate dioxygenase ferredoxin reductase subunit